MNFRGTITWAHGNTKTEIYTKVLENKAGDDINILEAKML